MSAKLILNTVYEEDKVLHKTEWLIDSETDTADIPEVAPGSVAYTADLSYMAMWDGTDWVQIGGGDE